MKFGRFTFGEDKHPEDDKVVDQSKILHEPDYIVMKARTGELTDKDTKYVSDHLDEMLEDVELQEKWSHVNFGRTTFQYRVDLKNIAAMYRQNNPNYNKEPYFLENKTLLVNPTQTGVEVYQITKEQIKNEGKPDETVELKDQSPWLVFPNVSDRRSILQMIANQRVEDAQIEETQKLREIFSGGKK